MSDINENEVDGEEEFSLADIAELDASGIAEVRFESLPAGSYVFRGVEAQLEDKQNAQDERRIVMVAKLEVIECKAVLEKGYDKEELVGKTHTEKFYVVPSKAAEGLGLIRAWIGDIGLPNEGPFGGAVSQKTGEPVIGIIDGIPGHEFPANIIKSPRKGDPTQKDARLRLPLKKR